MGGGGGGVVGTGLNILLLAAMVAANILSLYHLSSLRNLPLPSPPLLSSPVPDHLLHQLHTIRSAISHLTRLRSSSPLPPPELLLFSRTGPIASSCSDHPQLLHEFMSYSPFSPCPRHSLSAADHLILRGCHPLPRRRCFSPTPPIPLPPNSLPSHPFPNSLPDSAVLWPPTSPCRSFSCLHSLRLHSPRLISPQSPLDLPIQQLLAIASAASASPIRLGIDIAGGTATLAAHLKVLLNATILTTTMNLDAPYNEVAALRGVVPLHAPLQQRLPVQDGAMDIVRAGHAVNRWIPRPALEFLLFDVDRVLKAGGLFWIDHFFCRGGDLETVYGPMIRRLGYKRIKWAVGNKTDSGGVKFGEVYLTALLQKPVLPAPAMTQAGNVVGGIGKA